MGLFSGNSNDDKGKRLDEKLQVLLGERGDKTGMAITRGDVLDVGNLKLKAARITYNPTMSDFNNLVDDIQAINALFVRIAIRLDLLK